MANKGFRLVPAELPKRRGRSASTFYADIVDEFTKSGLASAAVEGTGKTPLTVWHGLKTALKNGDNTKVKVSKRKVGSADIVFLYLADR
jgi:hypothetical protein